MLGIFLYLFKLLGKIMDVLGTTINLEDCPKALGITKHGYWAQFDGNQTKRLLDNLDLLRDMLRQDRNVYDNEVVKIILLAMEEFQKVRKACFGIYLDLAYVTHIQEFAYHYCCLVNMLKDIDSLTFNVTLKVHILFCHVTQFLERQNEAKVKDDVNWIPKGLGYW